MSLRAGLDVGTTTIRLGLFEGDKRVALVSEKLDMHVPFAGAVEQDAAEFVAATERLWAAALAEVGAAAADVATLGIANQRATIVCWSSATGAPIRPAVGWQDARTAPLVAELVAQGIPVNTSASCTKMGWLLQNDPVVAAAAADGTLRMGTVDSWLTAALSNGEAFITDPGNAAATGMYDARAGDWSEPALGLFGVTREPLAEIVASDATVGTATMLAPNIALSARLGDQMAACAAHQLQPGEAKLTLGTSGMVNVHAGTTPDDAPAGCYTLPLWRRTVDGALVEEFMHEGSINTAGSVIEWLVRIEMLDAVEELDRVASQGRPDAASFVPALAGLGSPHHQPTARGEWTGLALDTTRPDMVRAVVDGIANRVGELARAMNVTDLICDGGLSQSVELIAAIDQRLDGAAVASARPEAALRGVALFS
ncbi:MAG: glycerol kinase [Candidatus Aldehydirespiratoraceae bacterium]|jgi:glycerol kinase